MHRWYLAICREYTIVPTRSRHSEWRSLYKNAKTHSTKKWRCISQNSRTGGNDIWRILQSIAQMRFVEARPLINKAHHSKVTTADRKLLDCTESRKTAVKRYKKTKMAIAFFWTKRKWSSMSQKNETDGSQFISDARWLLMLLGEEIIVRGRLTILNCYPMKSSSRSSWRSHQDCLRSPGSRFLTALVQTQTTILPRMTTDVRSQDVNRFKWKSRDLLLHLE